MDNKQYTSNKIISLSFITFKVTADYMGHVALIFYKTWKRARMFFKKVDVNLTLSFGMIAATEEKEETFYIKNVDVSFISESEDLRSYNFDGVFDEKLKELILGVSFYEPRAFDVIKTQP